MRSSTFKIVLAGAALALLSAMPAFAACTAISSKTIEFTGCIAKEWHAIKGTGAQEFSYLTADENYGLMVITEKETIPYNQFRSAIIQNAIKGSGSSDVEVVGDSTATIDGKSFKVVEYTIPNDGNPILFKNFYYSASKFGSLQILAYSLKADRKSAARKAATFTATVDLDG
jgi:hypothetical protein